MTACLLYAKIHKNKAENLLHLMLYFSMDGKIKKVVDKWRRRLYNIPRQQRFGAEGETE